MMNKKIYLFIAIIALVCLAIESTGEDWKPDPNSIKLIWDSTQMQDVLSQLKNFICWPINFVSYVASRLAALLLILAGVRYIAADDPGTRAEMRRYIIGIMVGLMIVLISIPVINFVIAGFLPGIHCEGINGSIGEDDINRIFCNLINALSTIGPWICAIMVVYGGLRYLASADDLEARKVAKTTIVAAFVGLVFIMLAIPLVNTVLGDALEQVDCTNSDAEIPEQIITLLGNFLCILALISPPICALIVSYGGLRYITSADDPGARDTAKTVIISALIGMILVMIAIPLVNVVFTASQITFVNSCLQGTAVAEVTGIMCNFMCFFSYIAPAICVLVVIYGGLRYLVSGDDPRARKTAKTIIISAFVGMVLVLVSLPMVNVVLTSAFDQVACDRCPDSQSVKDIVNILCKFICLIASVAPAIAALVMMYGGLKYITSAEDPEARSAAKTIVISAFVGLILMMISLAMVNIVVSGWAKDVQCGCFSVEDPATYVSRVFCTLACTLQLITPAIAAIVIMYGGVKYLTSEEDPSARASARGIVIHAIIGLLIIMIAIQTINIVVINLMPTFKCDCVKLFPAMFGQLGGAPADSAKGPGNILSPQPPAGGACSQVKCGTGYVPGCNRKDVCQAMGDESLQQLDCGDNSYCCCSQPVLRVLGVGSDEICAKCCGIGKTECHYSFTAAGSTTLQYAHPISGLFITSCNPPQNEVGNYKVIAGTGGSEVTSNPPANAKCVYCPDGTAPGECKDNYMCVYNDKLAEPMLEMKLNRKKCEAKQKCSIGESGKCVGDGWTCVCIDSKCNIEESELCIT